jgi:hypothetical protein
VNLQYTFGVLKYVVLIILALVLIYFFYPRGDDTREIEKIFNEITDAAGKKDLDAITEHFSIQYKDEYGAGYPAVKKIIGNVFEKYDDIDASYQALRVIFSKNEYGEKEASANCSVVVTGYKSGVPYHLVGSADMSDNITVTLKKSGLGGWKITEVEGLDTGDSDY